MFATRPLPNITLMKASAAAHDATVQNDRRIDCPRASTSSPHQAE